MENARFDALAKALGAPVSRRWLAAAAILGLVPAEAARANGATTEMIPPPCRRIRQQCASDAECCSGRCIAKADGTSRCGRKHGRKHGGGGSQRGGGGGGGGSTCGTTGSLCTSSADCCQGFNCTPTGPEEYRCLTAPPPQEVALGFACSDGDTCLEGSCQPYTESAATWMSPSDPTATFCLLDLGATCTVDNNLYPNWQEGSWFGCKGTQCWGSVCGNKVNVNTPTEPCGSTMDTCKNSGHNVWLPGAGGGICTVDYEGNGGQFSAWTLNTCVTSSNCQQGQRCIYIEPWSICNGSGSYNTAGYYCVGLVSN